MAGLGVTRITSRHRFALARARSSPSWRSSMIAELNGVLAAMRTDGGVAGSVTDLQVSARAPRLPTENDVHRHRRVVEGLRPQRRPGRPGAPLRRADRDGQRRAAPGLVPPRAPVRRLRGAADAVGPPMAGRPTRPARGQSALRAGALVGPRRRPGHHGRGQRAGEPLHQPGDRRGLERPPALRENVVVAAGIVKWAGLLVLFTPFAIVGIRLLWGVLRPCPAHGVVPDRAARRARPRRLDRPGRRGGAPLGGGPALWTMVAVAILAVAIGISGARGFQIGRTPITVRAQGRPLTLASLLGGRGGAPADRPRRRRPAPRRRRHAVARAARARRRARGGLPAQPADPALLGGAPDRRRPDGADGAGTAAAPARRRPGAFVPLFVGIAVVRATTGLVFYQARRVVARPRPRRPVPRHRPGRRRHPARRRRAQPPPPLDGRWWPGASLDACSGCSSPSSTCRAA